MNDEKIKLVQGRRCWGVRLVCGIQLNANSRRHECRQAGRCIFAPLAPDAPQEAQKPQPEGGSDAKP